jgi:hypothetical protein
VVEVLNPAQTAPIHGSFLRRFASHPVFIELSVRRPHA